MPLILGMLTANGKFRLKSDTSKTAGEATMFQFQQDQWILIWYHTKN